MNRSFVLASTLCIVSAAVGPLSAETPAKPGTPQALYEKSCASCHAKDGKGKPSMAKPLKLGDPAVLDLTRPETAEKTDEELIAVTAKGEGKMPAYEKKLTADQIKDLTAYIRTLAPKEE